jgi:hypothetical protein
MLIEVVVKTRARQNKVIVGSDGVYRIWTTKAPEKGEANEAVVDMLAKELNLPKSLVSIKKGLSTARKLIEINA